MSKNNYVEVDFRKFSHNAVFLLIVLTYFLSMKVMSVQNKIFDTQNNIGDLSRRAKKLLIEECTVRQKQFQKQAQETLEDDSGDSSEEGDS